MTPKTVAELASVPNIVGIKDSSGSFDNIQQYLEVAPSDFAVLAGTDSLILPTLMAGGKGAIAATANVFPEVLVSIYECWRNGDFAGAERAQRHLRALRSAFSLGTLPSVLKHVLNEIGVPAGPTRAPVDPLTPQAAESVKEMIEQYRKTGVLTHA